MAGTPATTTADAAALPLSLAMRRHTRKIHRRSDALVNLKLALAWTDPALYAQAIALFHPIYERLESLLPKAAQKEPALRPLVELILSGPHPLARSKAFEADLAFFLGPDWRRAALPPPRPAALESYLARLEEVPPALLAVYAFHMYMALLSGGQILRRLTRGALGLDKRGGEGRDGNSGTVIYDFGAEEGVPAAKERLRACVDGLEAEVLARDRSKRGEATVAAAAAEAAKLRASLLEESMRLFLQNNAVVGSFDTGRRGKQALLLLILVVLLLVGLLTGAGLLLIRGVVLGGSKG